RLAWSAFLLYLLLFVAGIALGIAASRATGKSVGNGGDIVFICIISAFPVVAILILSRQPRNRIGWILMAIGLAWVIGPESLGDFLISRGEPRRPGRHCHLRPELGTSHPPHGDVPPAAFHRWPAPLS